MLESIASPLRLAFAGALYYVISRGDGREAIYRADGDRRMLLGNSLQNGDTVDSLRPCCTKSAY